MGSQSAFFYGTLMAPQVLHRVCHGTADPGESLRNSSLIVRPAVLHSYRRHKVRDADFPAIVPSSSAYHSVRGTLVTGLRESDVLRLDIFEGSMYERRKVTVDLLAKVGDADGTGNVEGQKVETETYVWRLGRNHLEDDEWDFAEFVRDKMHRWVRSEGESEHAEVDEASEQGSVDPTGGRGANGAITKALGDVQEPSKDELSSAV